MKLARILYQGEACEASVECNGYMIALPAGFAGTLVPEQEAVLLPPVAPGKILGVGWNFRAHMKEMEVRRADGQAVTAPPIEDVPPPILFLKPPSSPIGLEPHHLPVDAPGGIRRGTGAAIAPRHAGSRLRKRGTRCGLTCANDVTERDLQSQDKQWWRAKGFDTFAVAGPFLETEARGETPGSTRPSGCGKRQVGDMIRDPFEIISLVSQAMTLERGDLIMLGTPPGVGELQPGDEVEVEIDGVGYLRNSVRPESE
jgi:2-keto-4-pentenoate hydratase/2-oxohepta-3-ene-1,7-dioic acid hydratase in catechol pathway